MVIANAGARRVSLIPVLIVVGFVASQIAITAAVWVLPWPLALNVFGLSWPTTAGFLTVGAHR